MHACKSDLHEVSEYHPLMFRCIHNTRHLRRYLLLRKVVGHNESRLHAVANPQPLENVGQMVLNGLLTQVESIADFLVASALHENTKNLPLTRCKVRQVRTTRLHLDVMCRP